VAEPRFIGNTQVSALGLGGASWSFADYAPWVAATPHPVDDEMAIQTIHAALDSGLTLIDTARVYTTAEHPGHSEALIARALESHPRGRDVLVATKGGHYRDGNDFPVDARRDTIRRHCEMSLRVLGLDRIDLYQLHLPDPAVPIREAMATLAELRDEGFVRDVGVCNVSIQQLEEAISVVPVVSVQNRFSPFHQEDREMVEHCAELSIAYLAHSPLGGGPPPHGGRAAALAASFPAAQALAQRKGISVYRLALAWLLSQSPTLIPLCGAGRPESIRDSALAIETAFSEDDLETVDFAQAPRRFHGGSRQ
jgi:aryl-alcohol dehydrogenase-like predicted oxidoreductase